MEESRQKDGDWGIITQQVSRQGWEAKLELCAPIHHNIDPSNTAHELLPVAWEASKYSSRQGVK